ncbi:MAG: (d)CMP kinase, partial [Bdellovibrionota bacterium]
TVAAEGREVDHLISEQKVRDAADSARKAAPMEAAPDAHLLDTTDLSLAEVVDAIEKMVREHHRFSH